jgi:hypothetical protein
VHFCIQRPGAGSAGRCETCGVTFAADALATWLIGKIADDVGGRLAVWVFGTAQERALRDAARVAVRCSAQELSAGDVSRADQIEMVIGQVFAVPVPDVPLARHALEWSWARLQVADI